MSTRPLSSMYSLVSNLVAVSTILALGACGSTPIELSEHSSSEKDSTNTNGSTYTKGSTDTDTNDPEANDPAATLLATHRHIWIANTSEGTLSKIDTETVQEVARYSTGTGGTWDNNPSRTSVNLNGDVAVANRKGGIAVFITNTDECEANNYNGQAGLQTSTGKDDVLSWEDDDCLKWSWNPGEIMHNRPVAWTTGSQDESGRWNDAILWTAVTMEAGNVDVIRLNETDGSEADRITIPEVDSGKAAQYGLYGAAVESKGGAWFTTYGNDTTLFHLTPEMDYELVSLPISGSFYGIAVDADDRVWITIESGEGSFSYDPSTGKTTQVPGVQGHGLMPDASGRIWVSGSYASSPVAWQLTGIDGATHEVIGNYDLESPESRGVSIDFHGYVWFVDITDTAYKFDPETQSVVGTYSGLNDPYTYSDMTGYALANVAGLLD